MTPRTLTFLEVYGACLGVPSSRIHRPEVSAGHPFQLQRLAAEVVELEEKALKARSEELKREREAAAEREAAKRAQAAATAALQERETLQSILDTLEVPFFNSQTSMEASLVHSHGLRYEEGVEGTAPFAWVTAICGTEELTFMGRCCLRRRRGRCS